MRSLVQYPNQSSTGYRDRENETHSKKVVIQRREELWEYSRYMDIHVRRLEGDRASLGGSAGDLLLLHDSLIGSFYRDGETELGSLLRFVSHA